MLNLRLNVWYKAVSLVFIEQKDFLSFFLFLSSSSDQNNNNFISKINKKFLKIK